VAAAGLELGSFFTSEAATSFVDFMVFFWVSGTSLTLGTFLLDGGNSLRQGCGFSDTRLDDVRGGVGPATEAARDLDRLELRALALLPAFVIRYLLLC